MPDVRPQSLYLLIGQSNMAGRGRAPAEVEGSPRVWAWSRSDSWVPARHPLHYDKPEAGVGPGLNCGVALAAADPQTVIGLIPSAVGGTSIRLWIPGMQDPVTKAHPYDDAVRRARLAMTSGRLAGILWHQGEADRGPDQLPLYAAQLTTLVARLRTDLQAPTVPFIAGELPHLNPRNTAQTTAFNNVLHGLVGQIPHFSCVSAADLRDGGDQLHLDTASAEEFGRRYAAAVLAAV